MAVKKRDVVLMGKNAAGDQTIDMPVTRLGNVEDSAEIKEKPVSGDYIPVIDMEDGGQMKKFPYTPSDASGANDNHRFYETDFTLTGGNGDITIKINILADIFMMTVNGKKRRVAQGRIKIVSYTIKSSYSGTGAVLSPSGTVGQPKYYVPLIWNSGSAADGEVALSLAISELTDDEVPFLICNSQICKTVSLKQSDHIFGESNYFPFWLESTV